MRGLASFASSASGQSFARIERHWGRDPAACLESLDDVLAHNLRAAFLMTLAEDEPEEHEDAVENTRAAGARIREAMSG